MNPRFGWHLTFLLHTIVESLQEARHGELVEERGYALNGSLLTNNCLILVYCPGNNSLGVNERTYAEVSQKRK